MDFHLTEEQELLRREVRHFMEREAAPVMRAFDEKEELPLALVGKMGELGLFGMTVSPDYGGGGYDYLSYIIAVEEVARVNGSLAGTVAAANSLGIGPVNYFGSEEQKRKYLPDLCAGRALWGFGLTEPGAGSDAGASRTRAVDNRDGTWTINGQKIFITNAANPLTAGVTVQAVTGERPDGKKLHACFLVEPNTPGFTAREMHGKLCWRASNTAELFFDDMRVPASAILGAPGDGFKQMLSTLDRGRLSIAAMGLGLAQGAFEAAVKYAKERKQFGRPIGEFQAIQFKLSDMAVAIDGARLQLYHACWLHDQGRDFAPYAAMAKLHCARTAHLCADHCLQTHGGYGLMEDYPAAMYYRDQRLLEIGEGTNEVQQMVIGRWVLGQY